MLLKSKAITQTELASAIGVSTRAIQDWLTGSCRPSAKHIRKMSEILEVPIESLTDLSTDFSERLRDLINGSGMTREEFAAKIQTSNASVYNWLNGAIPTPRKLKQIADFFNVSISSLTNAKRINANRLLDLIFPTAFQELVKPELIIGLNRYGILHDNKNAIEASKYLALLSAEFSTQKEKYEKD